MLTGDALILCEEVQDQFWEWYLINVHHANRDFQIAIQCSFRAASKLYAREIYIPNHIDIKKDLYILNMKRKGLRFEGPMRFIATLTTNWRSYNFWYEVP